MEVRITKAPKTCQAMTKSGKRCSREVASRYGCTLFCWQHAASYNKKKMCQDPIIKPCKLPDMKQKFPCKRQGTVYWRKKQYRADVDKVERRAPRSSLTNVTPKCERSNLEFPCRKKGTVFVNQKEYDEYKRLRKEKPRGEYKKKDRKIVAKIATEKLNRNPVKTPTKKSGVKRVTFG